MSAPSMVRTRAWSLVRSIPDPEMPVVTIEDLGILRDVVEHDQGSVHVTITPTYSACPAMETIRDDIIRVLTEAGFWHVDVEFVLAPAWSSDWVTPLGRTKLAANGIVPPQRAPGARGQAASDPVALPLGARCPRCDSSRTRETSRFGATSCKALWVCRDCLEPFESFKAI
ncbi:1,2-phenylacetyl-CoA epoxidase subunit PaaD [Nocardioides sp. AE5]|uniref:1,2-phenylacetyl-CoA epoxidase subunit PaaD n=1 Tax=Nocardioides sp. AE5 TaxID=2962573 RepID=UPI002881C9A1|nr:1,2-phenylacetyl-CoA epoxidase subunit PaaD [Nocardioides sp. AE5]MDT0201155.1 1,2-phenylacetyl-CoA epoxidase subunit PaaD [Nocardioides sp. AE5]